jgi:hypothetical protein
MKLIKISLGEFTIMKQKKTKKKTKTKYNSMKAIAACAIMISGFNNCMRIK